MKKHLFTAVLMGLAQAAQCAVFVNPVPYLTGTTPSGIQWTAVATGTALPIRSSGTQNAAQNGAPGAVAYYNTKTGQLSIDPKGWNLSLFNFTYTTGTVNISGSTPGPLRYASGTSPTSATVSGATGASNQRTLPAGTWTLITCAPARIAGTVSLVATPSLATSYDAGNGAAGTAPYSTNPLGEAVTAGWFTQPWAFPTDLIASGSVSSIDMSNWKTFGVVGTHANKNVLGYGDFRSTFQYTVNGVVGNMVGPVIPYTTTTTTTTTLTALPNPVTYGSTVTLTAVVSSTNATGTVTFKDGSNTLGTGSVSSGTATFTTSSLTAGSHSITAEYGGDSDYDLSTSSAESLTVNKATPTVTTAPTATALTVGQTLANSALSGGSADVLGTFAFTSPATQPSLGTATHSVTFTPTDSANYLTASASVSVTVNPPPNAAPVPANPTVSRSTRGLRVPVSLLATDAELDPLTFSGLSSTIGATVQVSGDYLLYLAPSEGDTRGDSVTYSVSDGHSTTTGTLTVGFSNPTGGQAANISVVGGSVTIRFAGIPGLSYRVQRADDLGFTVNVSNSSAFNMPATGVHLYSDPSPPAVSAYYRLVAQ